MFFPRLRRQAKWMFVFLALVFVVGFVAFGVGSNVGGTGLGDILGSFGRGDGGPSVSEAREAVEKRPNDPGAYRELARALQTDGQETEAIAPLERYVSLRPKDADAIRELAALYSSEAEQHQAEALEAQNEIAQQGGGFFSPGFRVGTEPAFQDRVSRTLTERANQRYTEAISRMTSSFAQAQGQYQKLVRLTPDDPALQLQLGQAATNASDYATAVNAYRRFLKLSPDDPSAPQVRQQIAQLQAALGQTGRR